MFFWLNALWEWEFRSDIRESVLKGSLMAYFQQEVRGEVT